MPLDWAPDPITQGSCLQAWTSNVFPHRELVRWYGSVTISANATLFSSSWVGYIHSPASLKSQSDWRAEKGAPKTLGSSLLGKEILGMKCWRFPSRATLEIESKSSISSPIPR